MIATDGPMVDGVGRGLPVPNTTICDFDACANASCARNIMRTNAKWRMLTRQYRMSKQMPEHCFTSGGRAFSAVRRCAFSSWQSGSHPIVHDGDVGRVHYAI